MSKKPYKEVFVSPVGLPNESDALIVLSKIREAHPASSGWKETRGYVEKRSDGWHAVRAHEKHFN